MDALIITLELNTDLAARLTDWRTRYFPPDRNYLAAHVTLFHAVPADHLAGVRADLREVAAETTTFPVRVPGPFSLGRGVALDVVADDINLIRTKLRARWLACLSPQDQPPRKRPHVTIQNKVDAVVARRTLDAVRAKWDSATSGRAVGLGLWAYRGGPWDAIASFAFPT